MSVYQRYLSRSLIFFSSLFIIFFLFIESNIGFKLFFNFTNRFFLGLKAAEISGNWRNFTMKNVHYNNPELCVSANSVHIILDISSLFNDLTIFKEIKTSNLLIKFKKENTLTSSIRPQLSYNIDKKNILIKYPVIFQKIYSDKILFQTPNMNIFVSNVLSGVKLINNNITFFPTYIDHIHMVLFDTSLKKKNTTRNLSAVNHIYFKNKINNFLSILSSQSKIFVPFDIDFLLVKCKKINFMANKISNFFSAELKGQIKNNIFNIKQVKINSNSISIKSYGKIIFGYHGFKCNIKNQIFIPNVYNKIINISFKSHFNNKFICQLTSNNLYKINIIGSIALDDFNHPFHVSLKSSNLLFFIKKKTVLEIKKFQAIIIGTLNNYSLCLKQILKISGMPSVFIKINGNGNLKNIFLKKINFFLFKPKKIDKKGSTSNNNNIIYNPFILKLIGNMTVSGQSPQNAYNLCIPKIYIDSVIMKKKSSIFGSLCYKNFHILESSGINIISGRNQFFLKGFIGKKNNINSHIYIHNLNHFIPNMNGKVQAISHIRGYYMNPTIMNKIFVHNLNWKENLSLKSIKILTNINTKKKFLGNFLLDIKKAQFSQFHIHSLRFRVDWNKNNQKFYLLFKSPTLQINLVLNSIFHQKSKNWHGIFRKIKIKTIWGEFNTKYIPCLYDYHNNSIMNNLYKKTKKIKNFFSYFLYQEKNFFSNIFNKPFVNFNNKISFKATLKWILGKQISYGKLLLISKNIKFSKKNKELTFFEDIDYLNLCLNFIDNDLRSKWLIKKSINRSEKQNISGKLNILDIYHKKKLDGTFKISNFPFSFMNFFTTNFKTVKGVFNSNIKFFGSLYHPEVSSNINFKNIFIKSDNLLKYITLFFPYFSGKIDHIKINQEIFMKKSNLLFTFNKCSSNSNHIRWNLLFNSEKIEMVIFPKIKINISSQLNLNYFLEKYDLIGYIKFSFFYFKINEKNFIL